MRGPLKSVPKGYLPAEVVIAEGCYTGVMVF